MYEESSKECLKSNLLRQKDTSQLSKTNPYFSRVHDIPDIILFNTPINSLKKSKKGIFVPDEQLQDIRSHIQPFQKRFLELGSGSGMHLLALASKNPDSCFIGFELRYKRAFRTAEKASQQNLRNIFVMRADAHTIKTFFHNHEVDGVYINFPDPWAKPQQLKHRLLSEEFFLSIIPLLKPNGFISFKTDHCEYFHDILNVVHHKNLMEVASLSKNLYESIYINENIPTEFEKLFLSKKQPIFYAKFIVQ
jgi:tRNA (guanine-N7-)-methyltransferase